MDITKGSKLVGKKIIFLLKYTLFIFAVFSLIFFIIASYFHHRINVSKKETIILQEKLVDDMLNSVAHVKTERIAGDLFFLRDSLELDESLNYQQAISVWMSFLENKKIYNHIRFIDQSGKTQIHISYENNQVKDETGTSLENEKKDSRFQETMKLKDNQIYISKIIKDSLDSNKDSLDNYVIIYSLPYYVNGQEQGVLQLSYIASNLFEYADTVSKLSNGSLMMINKQGENIFHATSNNSYFLGAEEKSIKDKYPKEWNLLFSQGKNNITTDQGFFGYESFLKLDQGNRDLRYSFVFEDQDWIFLSFISLNSPKGYLFEEGFKAEGNEVLKDYWWFYVIILFVSILMSFFISSRRESNEQIKYFSEYDAMTGVYNRRAGFQKMYDLFSDTNRKTQENACICFLDINGLKEVNDGLGHDKGDELIKTVVEVTNDNIRKNDFIARLGGDEFLIIFEKADCKSAEEIWKRIVEEFQKINDTNDRKYTISVSHGISSISCGSAQCIDDIINLADEKMYEEKREMKKNIKILK